MEALATTKRPHLGDNKLKYLTLFALVLLIAGCGGGGGGTSYDIVITDLDGRPLPGDGELDVHQGNVFRIRVDIPTLPASEAIVSYAIDLDELVTGIDINTSPCGAGIGTRYCEIWTIRPALRTLFGPYTMTIFTVGETAPIIGARVLITVIRRAEPGDAAIAISGGSEREISGTHSVALLRDNTLWSWGGNLSYQLGYPNSQDNRFWPIQHPNLGTIDIQAIGAGGEFSQLVGADERVRGWGSNVAHQLGDGTTTDRTTPVQVAGLTNVQAIAAGAYHSVALLNDGTLRAWGRNEDGQLGDGTTTDRTTPVTVVGITNVQATLTPATVTPSRSVTIAI